MATWGPCRAVPCGLCVRTTKALCSSRRATEGMAGSRNQGGASQSSSSSRWMSRDAIIGTASASFGEHGMLWVGWHAPDRPCDSDVRVYIPSFWSMSNRAHIRPCQGLRCMMDLGAVHQSPAGHQACRPRARGSPRPPRTPRMSVGGEVGGELRETFNKQLGGVLSAGDSCVGGAD
jgi:hypothetical protein